MLKKVLLVVTTIALLVPVGLAGVWLWSQAAKSAEAQTPEATSDYNPAQTITVVGQGSVYAQPDIVRATVGVDTSAETVSEAVQQNNTQMEAILAALKKAGIADKDIQTMNYSVQFDSNPQPVSDAESSTSASKPLYRVSNTVTVTMRDLDSVASVLDAVIEAGANNIWGVSFSLEDDAAAQADARAKAIDDAKARAGALAELSGVQLGPVMSVSEVVGGSVSPIAVSKVEMASLGGGSISPGELEISYQVQVVYFIEP